MGCSEASGDSWEDGGGVNLQLVALWRGKFAPHHSLIIYPVLDIVSDF